MSTTPCLPEISAVILAGGQSRRMGGADKALSIYNGKPLLAHVIAALRPQVHDIILNSNRPATDYSAFGLPVIADSLPDQPGPLAGLLTALQNNQNKLLLCVPCDMPCLPDDLVARMHECLTTNNADVCSVSDGEQVHAVVLLVRPQVLLSIEDYLASGRRKVQDWLASQKLAIADFSAQATAFRNINTPQDLV
ncbi:MAG: molybdenum cofactor guanylyltransferase MobA [Thiohalomonadaceae bacterium]